jgi:hypothetical protein
MPTLSERLPAAKRDIAEIEQRASEHPRPLRADVEQALLRLPVIKRELEELEEALLEDDGA